MHRLRHLLETAAARALIAALGLLPEGAGRSITRALARAVALAIPSRSRRARENLRAAFPGASDGQVAAWVSGMWDSLGQAVWEFCRTPRLTPEEYARRVRVEGMEGLKASQALGRGVVLFSGHVANWEWTSPVLAFAGLPVAAVGRRMKNLSFDSFLTAQRERHGVKMIPHKNAVREGLRWLKSGGVLGLLIDQRITAGGVMTPFFGRPAHTTTMPALLAARTGAAVHGLHARREGDGLRIVIDPAFDLSRFNGDAAAATAAMTAELERWVREDPPAWLWIHDRWKE